MQRFGNREQLEQHQTNRKIEVEEDNRKIYVFFYLGSILVVPFAAQIHPENKIYRLLCAIRKRMCEQPTNQRTNGMQSNVIQLKFNSVAIVSFLSHYFFVSLFFRGGIFIVLLQLRRRCPCTHATFFPHLHFTHKLNFCLYAILWVAKLLHMLGFVVPFRS